MSSYTIFSVTTSQWTLEKWEKFALHSTFQKVCPATILEMLWCGRWQWHLLHVVFETQECLMLTCGKTQYFVRILVLLEHHGDFLFFSIHFCIRLQLHCLITGSTDTLVTQNMTRYPRRVAFLTFHNFSQKLCSHTPSNTSGYGLTNFSSREGWPLPFEVKPSPRTHTDPQMNSERARKWTMMHILTFWSSKQVWGDICTEKSTPM